MCDIFDIICSKAKNINVDNQTCEELLDQFRFKLGLVAESVQKLPETYMKASTNDIINELHNTIHRIQLNDSTDLCIELINIVQHKFMPHLKNEIDIIIGNMNLIKSTWEICHDQYRNVFTRVTETTNEEMTNGLTSTLYLSNSFIKVVNDTFEKITTENVKPNSSTEPRKLASGANPNMDNEFFARQNYHTDIQFAQSTQGLNHDSAGHEIWKIDDVIEDFPVESMTKCNNDVFEIAVDTDRLIESLINKDSSYHSEKIADIVDLQQPNVCLGHENPSYIQCITNCFENRQNTDAFLMQKKLSSVNLSCEERHSLSKNITKCYEETQTKSDDFALTYSHSEKAGSDIFSKASSKYSDKLEPSSILSSSVEESNLVGLRNLSTGFREYAHPKTKDEVFDAIGKVLEYLQEECKWARKIARRNKIYLGQNSSRKTKISRPAMSAEVQVYIALGILPWDLKNKGCKPTDDSQCQIRVPEEIKAAILRYRSWYPTMHDKLYCFENHSKYLCDLELFGCWECIRKYFNEIYKWANKNGFVLREIRM